MGATKKGGKSIKKEIAMGMVLLLFRPKLG